MEESIYKSNVGLVLEKEKVSILESQLDEKAQLISEIQALNRSLSQQVEDYMNDIIDLKYVIGEQQPKVALLKEKEAEIADLQTKNEFLRQEAAANAGAVGGGAVSGESKIMRTRSLDLKASLNREEEQQPQ